MLTGALGLGLGATAQPTIAIMIRTPRAIVRLCGTTEPYRQFQGDAVSEQSADPTPLVKP